MMDEGEKNFRTWVTEGCGFYTGCLLGGGVRRSSWPIRSLFLLDHPCQLSTSLHAPQAHLPPSFQTLHQRCPSSKVLALGSPGIGPWRLLSATLTTALRLSRACADIGLAASSLLMCSIRLERQHPASTEGGTTSEHVRKITALDYVPLQAPHRYTTPNQTDSVNLPTSPTPSDTP